MPKRILPVLFVLLAFLCITPSIVSADANYTIQLGEHLPVTVQPGDTLSVSFDLRNDENYTWKDCVIIVEDANLKITGCDGGITYSNTGTKCYVQFKGLPVGTIYISNCSEEEVRSGTIWFSEIVPIESFEIGNFHSKGTLGEIDRVVGGDAYVGNYLWDDEYIWLDKAITPSNHENCNIESWVSSNDSIATVDGGGRITKIQAGKTTITATLSNGMTASYDLVLVEPEVIYSGYEKEITINPGERCWLIFDPEEIAEYVFYYEASVFDSLVTENIPEELQDYFSVGCYLPDHADYNNDYLQEARNGFILDYCVCKPGDNPYVFYCENMMPFENDMPLETGPVTLTVHFEKAPSIKSIEIIPWTNGMHWVSGTARLDVRVDPFNAKHEEISYSTSDDSVDIIEEFGNSFGNYYVTCDCVGEGVATLTAVSESGATSSQSITVLKPFVSGENTIWTQYSGADLVIEVNTKAEDLWIWIGDLWISPKDYSVSPGSTSNSIVVSISDNCLQSLNPGTYELLISGSGGMASTTLTVLEGKLNNPFTDVVEGSFFYEPVLWAVENGITSGVTETTFKPTGECTRAQVVTFLWRAAGCPEPASTKHPFTDVNESAFYYEAMLWAVEKGITQGVTKTTFGPDTPCNRGTVVTFLHRAENCPAPKNSRNPFTDVETGRFYYDAVLWAVENEVTAGLTNTTFGPGRTCTRGQVVTFLYRTYTE